MIAYFVKDNGNIMSIKLIYGIDYYIDKEGLMVLTKEYLLKKKKCCGNNCKNCPYVPRNIKGNTKTK